MSALHDAWVCDKATALCAGILAGANLDAAGSEETARLERATQVIAANITEKTIGYLADSTLTLLEQIPERYRSPDPEELPGAHPLADVLAAVPPEQEIRKTTGKRLPEILVAHAVYLLKQPHLSMRDFLRWLKRSKARDMRDVGAVLKSVESNGGAWAALGALLERSRDAVAQTRHRVDAVDQLYEALMRFSSPEFNMLWWLRICLALRSSLYCWPLMVAGSPGDFHGISLPFGLFLSHDGKSKVYFRIVHPPGRSEHRRYVPGQGGGWAHMQGSNLQWNQEWAKAFKIGLRVAKTLWTTQNGRLCFVDEAAAAGMRNASLVVDMGAACTIVDTVFGGDGGVKYPLSGRSAEAYWVQVVLGLMLPGREIPQGVVTGRVEMIDGLYEIRHVQGIGKKLQYANDAGFPRVVLPSIGFEALGNESDASETLTDQDDGAMRVAKPGILADNAASPIPRCSCEGAATDCDLAEEVTDFFQWLATSGARKRLEINFCRSVRNVADAMQVSGWRRTAFVRLPETQRAFSFHLRRLFLHEKVERGQRLETKEQWEYNRSPWTPWETRQVSKLDDIFLSDTRAIKFIDRTKFDEGVANGAQVEVGRWLAWKDHEARTGNDETLRGPGLGIFCLRTTETDNDMRLWSSIAELLCASPEWWDRFQWSRVDQAAQLLARLLSNQRADPSICATPAPDVLIIFDEGNLTQGRTNRVFPDDFHGQWVDLLNASKDNPQARHHLNEALRQSGDGRLGRTRIIVIYGPPNPQCAPLPPTLDAHNTDALERLAVFRFDFSVQAAYAMMNYGRPRDERLSWAEVADRLQNLVDKRMLGSTRGRFYVEPRFLPTLRDSGYQNDHHAHLHAAKALAPILEPRDLFIASNRDRTLEPENVLEATWHLQKARLMVPPRLQKLRTQCEGALSALTFLRPFPDWDTVKHLGASLMDAVELGWELLDKEATISQEPPHSSRVGALLNAIGRLGHALEDASARVQLAEKATTLYTKTLLTLASLSQTDANRQQCKLSSDFLYCMEMLGVPSSDARLAGPLKYLEGTIREVVSSKFSDPQTLDDYPLSRNWLRTKWDAADLPLKERSTYAYVAARLHIDRWSVGDRVREPWDQPWIEYFALTKPEDFDPRQLHSPLTTWQEVYSSNDSVERFGQRVRDFVSFLPSKKEDEISWWASKIRLASDNLWRFINHSDPSKRLRAYEVDIALRFIRIIALYETLPAFDFIARRGREWVSEWPRRVGHRSSDWRELAADVIGGEAGWINMLSSTDPRHEQAVARVQSWLEAYRSIGRSAVNACDPEDLRRSAMPFAEMYRRQRAKAIWNGYQLLAKRSQNGWVIDGDFRTQYLSILGALDVIAGIKQPQFGRFCSCEMAIGGDAVRTL